MRYVKLILRHCYFSHEQVREIISILDLDVLYYPCPQGGPNFRPKAIELGGKKQFPYMVCLLEGQFYVEILC